MWLKVIFTPSLHLCCLSLTTAQHFIRLISREQGTTINQTHRTKLWIHAQWLQTQRNRSEAASLRLLFPRSLEAVLSNKSSDSRLSCKWAAVVTAASWSKQTHVGSELRRQGRHLLLRGVQLPAQLSDLLLWKKTERFRYLNKEKYRKKMWLNGKWSAFTATPIVLLTMNETLGWGVEVVWGITVVFGTVWPLIEKKKKEE